MAKKGERRTQPIESQMKVLQILADASGPMRSSDLADKSGLFANEIRAACKWLEANGFITSAMKREPMQVGHSKVMKDLAYWSITAKGREAVAGTLAQSAKLPHVSVMDQPK